MVMGIQRRDGEVVTRWSNKWGEQAAQNGKRIQKPARDANAMNAMEKRA